MSRTSQPGAACAFTYPSLPRFQGPQRQVCKLRPPLAIYPAHTQSLRQREVVLSFKKKNLTLERFMSILRKGFQAEKAFIF